MAVIKKMLLMGLLALWHLAGVAAAPVRPVACSAGHPCVWLPRKRRYSISFRGNCDRCGTASAGGRPKASEQRTTPPPRVQNSRKHLVRDVRRFFGTKTVPGRAKCLQGYVTVEMCAGKGSKFTREAASLGAVAIRISKPLKSKNKMRGSTVVPFDHWPSLTTCGEQTWFLDISTKRGAAALGAFLAHVLTALSEKEAGSPCHSLAFLSSPPCTAWCPRLSMSRKRKVNPMPAHRYRALRARGLAMLSVARHSHGLITAARMQVRGAVVQIHEQSDRARCLVGRVKKWPSAIPGAPSAVVSGCSVGLRVQPDSDEVCGKRWRFECQGCSPLLQALERLQCSGGHGHVRTSGTATRRTEEYPLKLAVILAQGLAGQ